MALDDAYLQYPRRRYGMDHDRHDWSVLFRRKPVIWPGGAPVALLVSPVLEWFPMNMTDRPFRAPGGLERPYPDYRYYTHRDYGTRVGIFRIFEVLDALGIRASVAVNSDLAVRHPFLVGEIGRRDWEIIAHGVNMDRLHYGGMGLAEEEALVTRCLADLRRLSGRPVTGWLSPAKSESMNTLDLIARAGIEYVCDWVSDDLPFAMRTAEGSLYSMPHSGEIDDRVILMDFHHTEDEFVEQVKDQFDWLAAEAERHGGRVMSIVLHPWVMGHPYRMNALRAALGYIVGSGKAWSATASQILSAFRAQE
jgi:peptidoglycan/xylan/chitin deacetylase (PgdA/CDA1 family)